MRTKTNRWWPAVLSIGLMLTTITTSGCQFVREQRKERSVFVRMATNQNRPTTTENPSGEQTVSQEPEYAGDTFVFVVTKRW